MWFNFDGNGKYGQYCQYSMDEIDNIVQKMEDRRGEGEVYMLFRGQKAKATIGNNGETRHGAGRRVLPELAAATLREPNA